jgi:hypothetical protein
MRSISHFTILLTLALFAAAMPVAQDKRDYSGSTSVFPPSLFLVLTDCLSLLPNSPIYSWYAVYSRLEKIAIGVNGREPEREMSPQGRPCLVDKGHLSCCIGTFRVS